MINIQLDPVSVNEFKGALNKIIATSKRDMREVCRQQAKLLAIQCMHFTPPFAGGVIPGHEEGNVGTTQEDKKAGQDAVKRDILKTMISKSELFSGGFENKWLEKIVNKKDKEKLQKYFESVKSNKLNKYKVEDFSTDLHTTHRSHNDRFKPKRQNKFVFDEKRLKNYIKEVQLRVGSMKAGWAVSALRLGGTVPAWVATSVPYAKGSFTEFANGEKDYSITISNWTPSIGRFSTNYSIAMNVRANAMKRMYEHYLRNNINTAFKA